MTLLQNFKFKFGKTRRAPVWLHWWSACPACPRGSACTCQVETGISKVQSHPQLCSKFEANWGYMRPYRKSGGGKQRLFCEREGLGLISSTHVKRSGVTGHTCNPNAGTYRQTDPSLTYLVDSRSLGLYFKRQVGWLPRLSSDFYTKCAHTLMGTCEQASTPSHTPKR